MPSRRLGSAHLPCGVKACSDNPDHNVGLDHHVTAKVCHSSVCMKITTIKRMMMPRRAISRPRLRDASPCSGGRSACCCATCWRCLAAIAKSVDLDWKARDPAAEAELTASYQACGLQRCLAFSLITFQILGCRPFGIDDLYSSDKRSLERRLRLDA